MKVFLFCLFVATLFLAPSLVHAQLQEPTEPIPNGKTEKKESVAEEKEKPRIEETEKSVSEAPLLPAGSRELIDLLSDPQLDQATEAIRLNFLNPSSLNDKELKRAKLEGLLERLGPGAEIGPSRARGKTPDNHSFLAEVLDGQIGYVRLGGINTESLAQMDAVLGDLNTKKIGALILDLRAIPHGPDFEIAADFARRFAPKGRLLFRLEKPSAKQERIFTSNQDPVFSGTIMVLTNETTGGSAEVLAGVLRKVAGGMVIGSTTAGKPVEFAAFLLGGGVEVRVAVAEAVLGEEDRAFPTGIKPDLAISMPEDLRVRVFQLSAERGVSGFVFEKERPRLNEAALILNANPEIDGSDPDDIEKDEAEGLKDPVLQRAVDVVTALRLFNR